MPVSPTYPGVYIEELPSGVRTIVGVSTSSTAFVDFFPRGPMDKAVQVFNEGEFQREFGGLHKHSEASYAVRQYFMNGGAEAWVVRATNPNSRAAQIALQDGAGSKILDVKAGRQVRDVSVEDRGVWGNNLRIDVDYETANPTQQFNLTVAEISADGRQTVTTESYRNLTMAAGTSNYAVDVVNNKSKLVQLTRANGVADSARPAAIGTLGGSAPNAAANLTSGDQLSINLPGGSSRTATLTFTALANLQDVRKLLQAALRATGAATPMLAAEPLLTGATVTLVNDRFHVVAGRDGANFDPETVLTFGGAAAAPLGLTGAGVIANVQQYKMGSGTSVGAQETVANGSGFDGNLPTDLPGPLELEGARPQKTGLYALEDVDVFNILCVPRAASLGANAMRAFYASAITYCDERRAFLIVDLPEGETSLDNARDWLDDNASLRSKNAAAYFPRPRIPDPLNDFRLRSVGASGTMAGLYARTDASRGVWKAPAGTEAALRNVPDLGAKLTDPENGQLNPLGLNCLRNFDGFGNVAWGGRTLVGSDQMASEWKYVPVRRLALYIEQSLYQGTQWVVFEPNDEPLWAQVRLNVGSFMQDLFQQGAFQGQRPRDAYLVKCDSETTTQSDIDKGVINIVVGFAPLKPAEFVIIKIQQLAGQVQA